MDNHLLASNQVNIAHVISLYTSSSTLVFSKLKMCLIRHFTMQKSYIDHQLAVILTFSNFINFKIKVNTLYLGIGCLTPFIVNIFKIVLMLNLMAVFISLIGFLLDIIGTSSKTFYIIRTNGLLSIVTGINF
jgi:hypothetical protein